jgi:1,2-diacylglycerol 3-alpha-glucosyltransferase
VKILMMTNTYLPHVGGVARSVEAFTKQYRERGHQVLIVAPDFPDTPDAEDGVVRMPAIQNFNGTDFSVRLPIPGFLTQALNDFAPEIVHSHHPFLIGDTAQRVAARLDIPLVFTHHTMYERYTHYVPGDSPAMKRFVIELATHYANLSDQVFAPSESIADILRQRGVETPIESLPTGVDVAFFAAGDGRAARQRIGIASEAFVVGHLGRLAPEKNLPFLSEVVAAFLRLHPTAHFLVVGNGPSEHEIRDACRRNKVEDRLHLIGVCEGQQLVDAYHAMDVFAFASTSETQGLVLAEAMAAGVPVVAIDAPGVREVVVDRVNGRLLHGQDIESFRRALEWVESCDQRNPLQVAAKETAGKFATSRCADRALHIYESLISLQGSTKRDAASRHQGLWESTIRLIDVEYQLLSGHAAALSTAIQGSFFTKTPVARWIKGYFRRIRGASNRNEWTG